MREAAHRGGRQRTGEPLTCMLTPSSPSVVNIPDYTVDPDSKSSSAPFGDTCGETGSLLKHAGAMFSGFQASIIPGDLFQTLRHSLV